MLKLDQMNNQNYGAIKRNVRNQKLHLAFEVEFHPTQELF